ncbi:ammonium transporter [Brachybacterium saurashtrense]|uniref:Ammonium transporter n=1 Tax=Brachybacterium saurashtrense TaxID=556288 RepID=A0A345YKU5_9MICO|nr:ammonium transporter [Brachybacterium saurashtrense]AXK44547.1 ammonium transporter [Brachybacterium saurashtrense]RRR23159.1 ammonium transporter [Brachybacterium saurashtrense]
MEPFELDTGATAWILTSAALVLLMTPGLSLFYGGMVRARTVLNMMLMSFSAMAVVAIAWTVAGYSLAFGSDVGLLFGNPMDFLGLAGTDEDSILAGSGVPFLVAAGFQMTFAIISTALISGAIADRVKLGTWLVFAAVWVLVVYSPLAHMVWGGGLLSGDGPFAAIAEPVDFAGGTVVHINAGIAGLVLALVVGARKGFGKEPMKPHNLPLVMLGAALLWFGWFGFNAGSAGTADSTAGLAWVNTTVATAGAMLGWALVEKIRDSHVTSLGMASGVVAGLVAITPAAAALTPITSIILGLAAGVACAFAVSLKHRFGIDDSLDVVGVHLVGGLVGTIGIGFLAAEGGLFLGGGVALLGVQILVAVAAMVISGVLTAVIALVLKATMGWRIPEADERAGIDITHHAEAGYDLGGALSARRERTPLAQSVTPSAPDGEPRNSLPTDSEAPAAASPAVTGETR